MPPSEVFSDQIENRDEAEKLKKLKLKEKYAKIKSGLYEPDTDDESEWDVNDLSKNFFFFKRFPSKCFLFCYFSLAVHLKQTNNSKYLDTIFLEDKLNLIYN